MTTLAPSLSIKDVTSDWIKDQSHRLGEEKWLLDLRLAAFENFSRLPWPHEKEEKWKRSQLNLLKWDQLPLQNSAPLNQSEGWLSLAAASKSHKKEMEEAFQKLLSQSLANKFLSLNLAIGFSGSFYLTPKNQKLTTSMPIALATQQNGSVFHINLVIVDEGSELQLWEDLSNGETSGEAVQSFLCSLSFLHIKNNGRASHYNLQHWNENTAHFQFSSVSQDKDTRFNGIVVAVGARLFRQELSIHLEGQGAENKVLGLLFGGGKQNFENWISQYHTAQKTTSDIQYRGALKGEAHSFFSGLVSITKTAQQSDAYQASKSLLLSKDARADAIPNLEILADDVKCSHGAAVGPVDEDQKYYMQTRGISSEDAEKIIIQGFFEPVISEVPSEETQEKLRQFIEEKLAR